MKHMKVMSYRSKAPLVLFVVLSGCYCLAYSDEPSQGKPPEAKNSSGGGPLITITPKAVESIDVDGVKYNLEEAIPALSETLSSNDDNRKLRFLAEVKKFRQKLQGDVVSRLTSEYQKQINPKVRRQILDVVVFANDAAKLKQLSKLAKDDPDVEIRARAGAFLIEFGDVTGLDILTKALPSLNGGGHLRAASILLDGINRLEIPFVDSKGVLRPRPQNEEQMLVFLDEWSQWWKRHAGEVLKNSKASAQSTEK
jgi:hypothetical protein